MASKTQQIKWGFDKMQIGDRMTVPADLAARARSAANSFSNNNFWSHLFEFERDKATGNLTVTRVAKRAPRLDMNAQRAEYMKDPIYRKLVGESA